jgi:uncharacterized membrane-anchored protein
MSDSPSLPPELPAPAATHWLHGRERGVLLAAAAFQGLVLLAMIIQRASILWFGEPVLLRVEPVDPRDLFRGDYVILSYSFSRIPPGGIPGLPDTYSSEARDRPVFVTLVPEDDGRHYRAGEITATRPSSGKYIEGKVGQNGQLRFGIEDYYVQESTGLKYEEAIRNRNLYAEVAVTSGGRAALRGLKIE